MLFIVATNVAASRLPERRPTGMPHARAKSLFPIVKDFALIGRHDKTLISDWSA